MDDIDPIVFEWVAGYAAKLGVEAPTTEEANDLLSLAGVAARGSARQAAPLACWLVARAGITPAEALARARDQSA